MDGECSVFYGRDVQHYLVERGPVGWCSNDRDRARERVDKRSYTVDLSNFNVFAQLPKYDIKSFEQDNLDPRAQSSRCKGIYARVALYIKMVETCPISPQKPETLLHKLDDNALPAAEHPLRAFHSSRCPGGNAFLELDIMKTKARDAGVIILDLSVGTSDLPVPQAALEALKVNERSKDMLWASSASECMKMCLAYSASAIILSSSILYTRVLFILFTVNNFIM